MTTSLAKLTSVLLLSVGLSLFANPLSPANADPDFGQHVRNCAQVMGFDGTMNPAMHSGYAGWDPAHPC